MRRSATRRRGRVPALVLASCLVPSLAAAQVPAWQAGGGASLESYRFGDARAAGIGSLSLFTVPFAASSRVGRAVRLEVSGAYASGRLTRADGSASTLAGLTDTEVRASLPVGQGSTTVNLTAVGILPTGHATQTLDEAAIAGAVAADLLPFRITNWGSGGGMALAASVAHAAGDVSVGASAGYRVAGEFEPLDGRAFAYRPGNELRLRFAADRTLDERSKLSAQVTLFRYADDRLDGRNLFQSGTRIQAVTSYAFPALVDGSAIVYGGVLHRTRGSRLLAGNVGQLDPSAPAQTLLLLGSGARVARGPGVLLPSVDVRLFRREDGVGQGYVVGLGTSLERPVGGGTAAAGGLVLVPTLRARLGSLQVAEGIRSGFTGAELGLTVRFGGASR